MKTINMKDMLVVGCILIILYCLLRRPILERLEGDEKEDESCPKGCSSLSQISINQNKIDKLTSEMNKLQTDLISSQKKIITLEDKLKEAEDEARKQSDGIQNINI